MKLTLKQKVAKIEEWLDILRANINLESSPNDIVTVPVGNSKVFLDKSNKNNDKILIDYIVIKRSELSMVEKSMIETIFKLTDKG